MSLSVNGVKLGIAKANIKYADKKDLVLVAFEEGANVVGVFTQNVFCAAPVILTKQYLGTHTPRYLLINTGYANAGTGEQGMRNAVATCHAVAKLTGCDVEQVLPFSTGVIGEHFSVDKFESGLPLCLADLSEDNWSSAAEGIMTTDTCSKVASRTVELDGKQVTLTGMSKGAGMICPNMATMLGFVATDAAIDKAVLEQMIAAAVSVSFNAITVDGDTSTNDACMLIATGKAANDEITGAEHKNYDLFYQALESLFIELAQAIIKDAEGATKFVEVAVVQAYSEAEAKQIAYTIAHSPLVKTALFASDPNWGRILAALGRSGVESLDISKVSLYLDDVCVVRNGSLAEDYTEAAGAAVMEKPMLVVKVELGLGDSNVSIWTCDFSYDYVKINAEYRS